MRVAKLEIENFRGVRQGVICFKRHPVLIGPNNAGKTTVIEALALLLGRDRMVRELTEHDFHGSDPQPSDRIKLVATITDFLGDDPDQHGEWFRDGRAVPKWFDEASGTIHPSRANAQWKLSCQIAVQAYFDRESLAVETIRYFHDHDHPFDPFADDLPVGVPPGLIRQLGFYLIRASRTWDKVLSWGSELFRRTVSAAAGQPATAILTERDHLRSPSHPIESDPQIEPLLKNVNTELARCMVGAPSVQLRVTSTDSRSVLDAVVAHFKVAGSVSLPAARHGSGLLSLQGLLLLLELGRARAVGGEGFLMALEEPELHLPPSTQQQLVQRVQSLSTQTFITTHSPLLAALADPTAVLVLSNDNGVLAAKPFLLESLKAAAPNWERKFFQQSRIDVMTALLQPALLVPEGRADFQLLKTILKPLMLTEGWTATMSRPFGLDVGVVPTEDAKVTETFEIMSRLHDQVSCLVDGDKPGLGYAKALLALAQPPASVIRWHEGAVIEDVVGWVLAADEAQVLKGLATSESSVPITVSGVVDSLKAHKLDVVAYESVADAIANNPACRTRAADLFNGLAAVCLNEETERFARDQDGAWVFQP